MKPQYENHADEYREEENRRKWERKQRNKNAGLHPNDPRYVNEDEPEEEDKP